MHPAASTVLQHISRDALVELASELIRIPSFKGEETPLARFLATWFDGRGYSVELDEVEPGRFQTIAKLRGSGGGKSLMFNGHIDINSLTRGWARDPWTPWVEGDRLYGHGAQNMKGGLAAMIGAADALRQSGVTLKGDLVIACVVGETQGGEGTHHLMNRGVRTDMAVLAEPFGAGNIATVHCGIVHLAIHTFGKSGHMSRPQGTVHAVHKMAKVIGALQAIRFTYKPREDLPELPRLNIGSVIGGRGDSYILYEAPYIPDLCTIIVDVHFLPGQTVAGIVDDIRAVLGHLKASDPEFTYEIEIPPPPYFKNRRRLVMEPVDVPTDAFIVQAVARSYQSVTGAAPKNVGAILPMSYTACDSSWLWKAGIPCVNYGPTTAYDGAGPASAYVVISEMEECARVLALTALDVCTL